MPDTIRIGDRYAHNIENAATIIAIAQAVDGTTIVRVRRWVVDMFSCPLDVTLTRDPLGHWHEGGPSGAFLTRLYAAKPGEEFAYSRRVFTRIDARDANLPGFITLPLPDFVKPWPERHLSAAEERRVRRNYGLSSTAPLPDGNDTLNGENS